MTIRKIENNYSKISIVGVIQVKRAAKLTGILDD